jgi:diazepam-binding inhibitor (GABA receptor modulator, acyl-CoA-binding protein)
MSLADQFEDAQRRVKALSRTPSNQELLELYALYKQSMAGDVTGSRPGLLDVKGRAKYDAWSARRGLSREQAMEKYVALVDRLTRAGK